jgi:Ala-tRNA(Pro) deacylase
VSAATPGDARAEVLAEEVAMPISSLVQYLDKHGVQYSVISHSPAYTAQGLAALSHIPGKELAKSVVVKVDGELTLAVLPASFQVDLAMLKRAIRAKKVEIASENEFRDSFPECETGAMPPFGNLYGMRVVADETLAQDKEITFNACSHRELIRLSWEDFQMLANPKMAKFATKRMVEAA